MMPTEWALGALLAAAIVPYAWRSDFERYSVATVGVFDRLERRFANAPNASCAEVDCDVDDVGEARHYFREIVLFGAVVCRYGGGVNHYCEEHLSFEARQGLENPEQRSTTERVATAVVPALVDALGWLAERKLEHDQNDSPLDDAVTTTHSAFSLLPVILLVLMLVPIVALVNWLQD